MVDFKSIYEVKSSVAVYAA